MVRQDSAAADSLDWYNRYRRLVAFRLYGVFEPLGGGVYDLCRYHMGWIDENGASVAAASGKMLRPVLCLAACSGYGDPARAVAVAASIEILHAFSLVHDDIEDGDQERRHRRTVWHVFGVPMAINAGDALYALAFETLHAGADLLDEEQARLVRRLFSDACLRLVEGQHLDIDFEMRPSISLDEYLQMARGKTGALIGAALALGALCGGAGPSDVERLQQAGIELGLAFQAADDALAFWGDPAETGKAVGNDLLRGKKSLPVVLAGESGISIEHLSGLPLSDVLSELERADSRERCETFALEHAESARRLIAETGISPTGSQQLTSLIDFSVTRVR